MGTLEPVIDALQALLIIFPTVPHVGESLKSAAELSSKICEQVQVRMGYLLGSSF
jgi:hypothetical protein